MSVDNDSGDGESFHDNKDIFYEVLEVDDLLNIKSDW